MDGSTFDHLARRLAAPGSRRAFVAGLAALAPAPALARKKKPPVACAADGDPCADAADCCGGGCNKAGPCTVKKKGKTKLTGNCRCLTVPCTPDCAGKACGGDGCGGSCGACADGGSCAGGTCACPAAKPTECQGTCVDTGANEHHCGGCDQACPTDAFCSGGRCYCPIGTTYCRSAAACVDTDTSPGNCGRCGNACAANQTCADGQCRTDCPDGQRACGSVCIQAACCVDADCPDGRTCQNGACACRSGTDLCGDVCVRLDTDEANCGACGATCPAGARCIDGDCFCPRGQVLCGDTCVDLDSNADHCGRCHAKCAVGKICTDSVCLTIEGTCPPTYVTQWNVLTQCNGSTNWDCFCWQTVEDQVRCYQNNFHLDANCTSSAQCESLVGPGAFCAKFVPNANFPGQCYKPCTL